MAQTALRGWLSLIMVGIAAQFFFAGAGAFGATSYDTHKTVGSLVVVAGLIAVPLAFAAARSWIRPLVIGAVLLVVQGILGSTGLHHPWLGALHGLNALAIAAVYGSTTGLAWKARSLETTS
jgi:hypothetical protein